MENYTANAKLSTILKEHYLLLPVVNRFGILPGFGDRTVDQVCKEKKIDAPFFLAIINTFVNENYWPETELLSFSPLLIVDYLKKTHQYYRSHLVPKIEKNLNELIETCDEEFRDLGLIETFYEKYKNELLTHINYEDEKVFPYIIKLFEAYSERGSMPEKSYTYSIEKFKSEHTNVEEKIGDLKNLLIKYLEPRYDVNLCNEFLSALFHLEKDLGDHARIEDKILIPMIQDIENTVVNG